MRRPSAALVGLLLGGLVVFDLFSFSRPAAAQTEAAATWAGKPLLSALRELERRGLRLIYSSHVVRPKMRVESEPRSTKPRKILDEILAPHALEAMAVPGRRWAIVPAKAREGKTRPEPAPEKKNRLARNTPAPPPQPLTLDGPGEEIVVSASFRLYHREPVHPVALEREEIAEMPHFGDDLYRVVGVLPGIATSGLSSRFHVRGGLYSEILVELDGVELTDPFHLKDAQGLFSILDPAIIAKVDLLSGGFSVEYGDRMTGVLDISSAVPEAGRRLWLGVGITHARSGGSGSFAGGRGRYLALLRRGYLDLLFTGEPDESLDPQYWDGFGKLELELSKSSALTLSVLAAEDWFKLHESDPPHQNGHLDSAYGDAFFGLSHRALWGTRAWAETLLSHSALDRDRDIFSLDYGELREVRDIRSTDIWTLKESWGFEPNDRHHIKAGVELRRYEARYDYENELAISEAIARAVRFRPPVGPTAYAGRITGDHGALYLADRIELRRRLVAELGARWDRQSATGEDQLSPRLHLVFDLERWGALRAGWGHFSQSQRPHELAVADGETELHPAERAEHWTAGWERQFGDSVTLRLEAYRREVKDPRPRYENLFDPFTTVMEGESDRVRIAAERSTARGLELFLGWRGGGPLDGWLTYALSSAEDRVAGRDQPRSIDQRHAVTVAASYRPGPRWSLTAVWQYRSGWPTTAVAVELGDDGEPRYLVGPFYAENLPPYQRVDLRVSRRRGLKRGELTFYLDVRNLLDRRNVRGLEFRDGRYNVESGRVVPRPVVRDWPGTIPSFGVNWSF